MKILVIDDESVIRLLAEKILCHAGHEVLLAESGVEGLQKFRDSDQAIDLVIVDLTMEGISGAKTLAELRLMAPTLPAIISTGCAVAEQDFPAELATNTHFLRKPYRAHQLADKVTEILQQKHQLTSQM